MLRNEVFFKPTQTPIEHLFDEYEDASLHVVALSRPDEALLGYGRMTLHETYVHVSQFVVKEKYRGTWNIWHGLYVFIRKTAEEAGKEKLVADARLHAVNLYRRIGFTEVGEPFPSKKTQIIHQRMEQSLRPSL